jgi:hypothetical protein
LLSRATEGTAGRFSLELHGLNRLSCHSRANFSGSSVTKWRQSSSLKLQLWQNVNKFGFPNKQTSGPAGGHHKPKNADVIPTTKVGWPWLVGGLCTISGFPGWASWGVGCRVGRRLVVVITPRVPLPHLGE